MAPTRAPGRRGGHGLAQVRPLRPARRNGAGVRLFLLVAPVFLVLGAGLALATRAGDAARSRPSAVVHEDAGPPSPVVDAGDDRQATAAPEVATSSLPLRRPWLTDSRAPLYDPRLAGALDTALESVDGRLSVVVKDLGTGRGALLSPDAEMPAASLFKLTVLYSVFAADVPLDENLFITDQVKSFDLGTLELQAGETLTVAEALERMVTISDNSSAILLANRVTTPRIDHDIAALGLQQTHYRADRLTTSAQDTAALLEHMARGQAVSTAASADMVHLLLRQRVNDRLPSLLPPEAQVAHKTGNLPGIVNDVGLIYGPHSTIVVAALVADSHDDATAAQGIARAAAAAYAYAESNDGATDRPTVPSAPSRPIPAIWREPRPVPADVIPTAALPLAPAPMPTAVPASSTGSHPATATPTETDAPAAVATNTPAPAVAATTTAPTSTPTPYPAIAPTRPPAATAVPAAATRAAPATPAPTPRPTSRSAGR